MMRMLAADDSQVKYFRFRNFVFLNSDFLLYLLEEVFFVFSPGNTGIPFHECAELFVYFLIFRVGFFPFFQ